MVGSRVKIDGTGRKRERPTTKEAGRQWTEKEGVFEEGGREGYVMAFFCFPYKFMLGSVGKLGNCCSCIPSEAPKLGLLQPE